MAAARCPSSAFGSGSIDAFVPIAMETILAQDANNLSAINTLQGGASELVSIYPTVKCFVLVGVTPDAYNGGAKRGMPINERETAHLCIPRGQRLSVTKLDGEPDGELYLTLYEGVD